MPPRWYDADELPDARPSLVGVVEIDDPAPLELHVHEHRGRTVAVWRDERGVPLRTVVASRA